MDAQDQKDIQDRIVQEEKRRQDILANIEAARKEREARKNSLINNLNSEKDARLAEIEKMKEE